MKCYTVLSQFTLLLGSLLLLLLLLLSLFDVVVAALECAEKSYVSLLLFYCNIYKYLLNLCHVDFLIST